jgi:hypothetical protein
MADLNGSVGELSFTISITSKETGETREIPMVGFLDESQLNILQAETKKEK